MGSRRALGLEDHLLATISDLYGAVADQRLWQSATARLMDMIGGICATHVVIDRTTGSPVHQTFLYDDANSLDRYYEEGIADLDPQLRFALGLGASRTWVDLDHLDYDDPKTAEYYRWLHANSRLGHHLSAGAILQDGAIMGALSVHRPRQDGTVSNEQKRFMDALLPHFHRASELAVNHAAKVQAAYWDGLLAQRDDAVALISRDGCLIRATPALEALIAKGDGIDVAAGRFRAQGSRDDAVLQAIITRATGRQPSAGAVCITRPSGRTALAITVYPLTRSDLLFARDDIAGLLTIIDPAAPQPQRGKLYDQAFGLTPRETEVAGLLMTGHSLESAAAALDISRNTARLHLSRLFAKTGTSRQSELVRLLGRM